METHLTQLDCQENLLMSIIFKEVPMSMKELLNRLRASSVIQALSLVEASQTFMEETASIETSHMPTETPPQVFCLGRARNLER